MASILFMTLGAIIYLGIAVEVGSVYQILPNDKCLNEFVIKIGDYSYFPTKTHEFSYIPTNLEFDAHDNLFALLEDQNDENPYKVYVKPKHSNEFEMIKGLGDEVRVQGMSYDNHTNKMYFATENGVYVYVMVQPLQFELVNFALEGTDVYEIDFDKNGNAYIATYKNSEVFKLEDGNEKVEFNRVPKATSFKIDNDDNFFFVLDDDFYVLWAHVGTAWSIPSVPDSGYKTIAFDSEGNGYVAYKEGLLFLKHGTKKFVKVEDLRGAVTSIAIDSEGNIVLGYKKKLFNFARIGPC